MLRPSCHWNSKNNGDDLLQWLNSCYVSKRWFIMFSVNTHHREGHMVHIFWYSIHLRNYQRHLLKNCRMQHIVVFKVNIAGWPAGIIFNINGDDCLKERKQKHQIVVIIMHCFSLLHAMQHSYSNWSEDGSH